LEERHKTNEILSYAFNEMNETYLEDMSRRAVKSNKEEDVSGSARNSVPQQKSVNSQAECPAIESGMVLVT
jgi:hypothetical protein